MKGDGCTSIDKRLSEVGAVLRANTAAVLLDGLSKLEEQASPVCVCMRACARARVCVCVCVMRPSM